MKTFFAAAALALLAAPALAQTDIAIGYENYSLDGIGDQDGVGLRYDGAYANGVEARVHAFVAEGAPVSYSHAVADASWKWQGLVGPKVSHYRMELDDLGGSATYAGLTLGRDFGDFRIGADVLSNVEDFGGDALLAVRADWKATPKLELGAEFVDVGDAESDMLRLHGVYALNERFTVRGEYGAGSVGGLVDVDQAFVGVGFRF